MIYRIEKGSPLTYQEHDDNFRELSNSIAAIESNSVILSSQISCTPISGLTYAVRADRYNIGGFYYKAAPINITLLTADNTYDRLDIIYADVFGNIGKITGTPGAVISTPDFDPEKQFLIKFILVKAGASVGTDPQTNIDLTKEQIYLNGIQNNWLLTTSNDVISESIVPISITGVETILGDYFILNNPTPIIVGNYDSLVFDFQNTSGKVYFNIRFFKNGIDFFVGAKTIKSGVFGFTSQNYQLQKIVIPLVEFNFSTTDFNKIEIEVVGPNSAWYFNNIHLTTGTNIIFQPTPITASEVKVLYESNANTNPFTDADKNNLDLSKTHAESVHIQQSDVNTAENNAKSYSDGLITQIINGAPADANTLKELNDKILAVQAIIGGTTADGDAIVNTVAELLAVFSTYTEGVDLVTLLAGKVNTTDIYNALDSIVAGKVLDAQQGKVLKDLIDTLTIVVNNKQDALGFTPENVANKSQDIETDKASVTKYGAIASWVTWLKNSFIGNLPAKATALVDTDVVVIGDSEDTNKTKTRTFAQLKATLKTYLDTLYQPIGGASDPAQITITTAVSITTDTLGNAGKTQKEKNVIIDNGVNAINITVNGGTNFLASYLKHGTGAITFVQGTGRTLIQVDATAVLSGAVGGTATISSVGTTDYLRISKV